MDETTLYVTRIIGELYKAGRIDDACDTLKSHAVAHVAEAVRPFAQAIVGLDGIWKDGYICPFCESGYGSYADSKWTWDHKPGCIVPEAQQALEGKS